MSIKIVSTWVGPKRIDADGCGVSGGDLNRKGRLPFWKNGLWQLSGSYQFKQNLRKSTSQLTNRTIERAPPGAFFFQRYCI